MKATWRLATHVDESEIARMSAALFVEDPALEKVDAHHIAHTLWTFRDEPARGCAVVCESNDAIVGYALLAAYWSNEFGGETCLIDELYIDGAHRGRGLATALFTQLHGNAKSLFTREPVAIALEVSPKNVRARGLYERLGFKGHNTLMRRAVARR